MTRSQTGPLEKNSGDSENLDPNDLFPPDVFSNPRCFRISRLVHFSANLFA